MDLGHGATGAEIGATRDQKCKPRRGWLAALLALFSPGQGHLYVGRWRLSLCFFFSGPILLLGVVTIGAIHQRNLLQLVFLLLRSYLAIRVVEISWAWRLARNAGPHYRLGWFNHVLIYICIRSRRRPTDVRDLLARTAEDRGALQIPSASIAPTLLPGDQLFVLKSGRQSRWDRGDVVVFHGAGAAENKVLVGRVMARGGDTVDISNRQVSINGRALAQRPCNESEHAFAISRVLDPRPIPKNPDCIRELTDTGKEYLLFHRTGLKHGFSRFVVKPNHFFIMGDNRDNSWDSRIYGEVPDDHAIGRAVEIWLSFVPEEGIRWARMGVAL